MTGDGVIDMMPLKICGAGGGARIARLRWKAASVALALRRRPPVDTLFRSNNTPLRLRMDTLEFNQEYEYG